MDIVSHLLFGRALAAVVPRPALDRGLTAAVVIASIAPDVDAVLMPTGWDRYLLWHQRGTHALVGTMAVAIVLAGLIHVVVPLRRRRAPPRPLARVPHLVLAAWVGCLGHITLDLVSGGTIRLLAPFSTIPFGVAWMAMGDPLIAVPLLAFIASTLIWRRHARRQAAITLIALAALVGVKEVSRRLAARAYARATTDAVDTVTLEGAWGSLTRWWAYDRSPARVRAWEVDASRGTARLLFSRDRRPADASPRIAALVDASTRLDTVQHAQTVFVFTFVEAHRRGGDLVEIVWSDISFCDASDCALWFGAMFGADGRPLEQVVTIGTVRQTRPP